MQLDYYKLLSDTCRDSYYAFVKNFWGTIIKDPPVFNWHIKYLCDLIQESVDNVIEGQKCDRNLLVNISPGTTKSTLFSVMLAPWAWTRAPHLRIIGASYTDALALDLSGKSRLILESPLYQRTFPHIGLSDSTNSKSHWANSLGGERYGVAVGGSVTGMHAHIIVIDDPIDPKGVRSKADMETANLWCRETISSRKVDKDVTATFVVMQRLHQNDPSELYLSFGPEKTRHICLPGELTEKVFPRDLRDHYQNGLFDPVRMSRSILEDMKMTMGQFGYSGQVLQDPIPLGGGMFKPDRIIEVDSAPSPKDFKKIVRFWDKAATDKKYSDYTAGCKMGLHKDGSYWILDMKRGQWSTDEREQVIVRTAHSDGVKVRIGIEQEPGSAGVDSAKETIKRLAGFNVDAERATGKKELRADTFSVQVNAGTVYAPKAPYLKAMYEELAFFPNGKNDDQVDACSGAFAMLQKTKTRLGVL